MHAHNDPNRDSLACDLMEPVRPAVDRYVFELLGHRTFTKEDVFELLDGQCRLLPPLTHDLAATASECGPSSQAKARMAASSFHTEKVANAIYGTAPNPNPVT